MIGPKRVKTGISFTNLLALERQLVATLFKIQILFTTYDPTTNIFAFRGEKFDVQALASGLEDIYKKASQRLEELQANRVG